MEKPGEQHGANEHIKSFRKPDQNPYKEKFNDDGLLFRYISIQDQNTYLPCMEEDFDGNCGEPAAPIKAFYHRIHEQLDPDPDSKSDMATVIRFLSEKLLNIPGLPIPDEQGVKSILTMVSFFKESEDAQDFIDFKQDLEEEFRRIEKRLLANRVQINVRLSNIDSYKLSQILRFWEIDGELIVDGNGTTLQAGEEGTTSRLGRHIIETSIRNIYMNCANIEQCGNMRCDIKAELLNLALDENEGGDEWAQIDVFSVEDEFESYLQSTIKPIIIKNAKRCLKTNEAILDLLWEKSKPSLKETISDITQQVSNSSQDYDDETRLRLEMLEALKVNF